MNTSKLKQGFHLFLIPVFLTFIVFEASFFSQKVYAADSLQTIIDQAKSGDTITLTSGIYSGSISIKKTLTLRAEGDVRIVGTGEQPTLLIETNQAHISGITVVVEDRNPESIAVLLQGNENRLSNLRIITQGVALKLQESQGNILEKIQIEGTLDEKSDSSAFLQQGNGIDLWESHGNAISESHISGVQDGIYLESSNSNQLQRNLVTNSRYGYHIMFAKDTILQGNQTLGCVTGAMIMQTDGTKADHNQFVKSSENVHSQGVLLYDTQNAVVSNNLIANNRLGIYLEQSVNNRIVDNQITQNYIGIQLRTADHNLFTRNTLLSNIIQGQGDTSGSNQITGNYWEDHQGIDLGGIGKSALPYQANPFFLTLTDAVPPYQLFFQAPGMTFLEQLFQSDTTNWLTDDSPLMQPVYTPAAMRQSDRIPVLAVCGGLVLLSSILFFRKGVLKK